MPKPVEVEEFDENAGEPTRKALDQSRPPLTWTGEKLHTKWIADFVGGKLSYKPRPWLRAVVRAVLTPVVLFISHPWTALVLGSFLLVTVASWHRRRKKSFKDIKPKLSIGANFIEISFA